MNKIEKVIEDYNKTLNNPSVRFIVKELGIDLLRAVIGEIANAGENKISLIETDKCDKCLSYNTGTKWVSQTDVINLIKKSIK